jgi:hypothetical protein
MTVIQKVAGMSVRRTSDAGQDHVTGVAEPGRQFYHEGAPAELPQTRSRERRGGTSSVGDSNWQRRVAHGTSVCFHFTTQWSWLCKMGKRCMAPHAQALTTWDGRASCQGIAHPRQQEVAHAHARTAGTPAAHEGCTLDCMPQRDVGRTSSQEPCLLLCRRPNLPARQRVRVQCEF